jgi:hypothetical protein
MGRKLNRIGDKNSVTKTIENMPKLLKKLLLTQKCQNIYIKQLLKPKKPTKNYILELLG